MEMCDVCACHVGIYYVPRGILAESRKQRGHQALNEDSQPQERPWVVGGAGRGREPRAGHLAVLV